MKGRKEAPRGIAHEGRKAHTMFTIDTTPKSAITKFEVIRRGKLVETFDSYEAAWAFARTLKGAMVRYFIKKK